MLIETKELSFVYPEETAPALDGVSIAVPEGSFVTLCGESGCGKSTLLRLMKPYIQPRGAISGDILFDGQSLDLLDEREAARQIGFVAQNPEGQIVTDRVWHELSFSAESVGIPPQNIRRRVSECAEYFGLERLFESDTMSLSGGEKQLVSLAAAAALHPRVMLLDEPTSQLDPIAAQGLIDTIVRLNRDFGVTVLIAEHRLEELLPVSDRVIVLEKGRVIADCAPRSLAETLPDGHAMLAALPAATRIFAAAGGESEAPLTVREGRANELCRRFLAENAPQQRHIAPKTEKPLITAKELWVSYGGAQTDAIKSASISLYGGEVYALLGGNGSGKTTLLKAIAGIVKTVGGKITRARGAKLAYLPQNPCELLGEETAEAELTARGISPEKAEEMLAQFGLFGALARRNPLDLSGGEQQRLALAVLLSQEPDVLLLDEPTKGMDAQSKQRFAQRLRGLAAQGIAVLTVTHDTEFAALCADKCGLLFNGEITSEGAPTEFFRENYFYTTPLCRMARGISEGWI